MRNLITGEIERYAAHAVVLGPTNCKYSADYPGVMQSTVERDVKGAQVMFVQGGAGDINPLFMGRSGVEAQDFKVMQTMGELLAAEGNSLTRLWDASHEPEFQPEALAPARAGGCWIVAKGSVRRFEGGGPQETRGLLHGKSSAVSDLLEDRAGNVWTASYGGGIVRLGPNGVTHVLTREQGLPSDLVRCLFEDQEGNVWAGLEGRGLISIRPALRSTTSARASSVPGESSTAATPGGVERLLPPMNH